MPTAYMVTTGSYSDYTVEAVFTTREGAEALAAKYPPMYANIEEKPLDEQPGYPEGMFRFRVVFDIGGECSVTQTEPCLAKDGECTPWGSDGKCMATWCWARDKDHAAKIANERRAQIIAMGRWAPSWEQYRAMPALG